MTPPVHSLTAARGYVVPSLKAMSGPRANHATPLPKRWMRARRWFSEHGLDAPNISSLKLMLDAESKGWG